MDNIQLDAMNEQTVAKMHEESVALMLEYVAVLTAAGRVVSLTSYIVDLVCGLRESGVSDESIQRSVAGALSGFALCQFVGGSVPACLVNEPGGDGRYDNLKGEEDA